MTQPVEGAGDPTSRRRKGLSVLEFLTSDAYAETRELAARLTVQQQMLRRAALFAPVPGEAPQLRHPNADLVELQEEANELLASHNDFLSTIAEAAVADAVEARTQARRNLRVAWVAVGVTILVGIVQIIVDIVTAGPS